MSNNAAVTTVTTAAATARIQGLRSQISALQVELEDYQVLYSMSTEDLKVLLRELVQAEVRDGLCLHSANWKRKMRVQYVLSDKR